MDLKFTTPRRNVPLPPIGVLFLLPCFGLPMLTELPSDELAKLDHKVTKNQGIKESSFSIKNQIEEPNTLIIYDIAE